RCLRLADITDGTSHTALVGEKAMDPANYDTGSWYYDEPFFTGGSEGTARIDTKVIRDAIDNDFRSNWGAAHPPGAQFVLADASVRLVPYGADWLVMRALMTPTGGEIGPNIP